MYWVNIIVEDLLLQTSPGNAMQLLRLTSTEKVMVFESNAVQDFGWCELNLNKDS